MHAAAPAGVAGQTYGLGDLLRAMLASDASDVYVRVGTKPLFRIANEVQQSAFAAPDRDSVEALVAPALTETHREQLRTMGHVDFAYSETGLGRFRINVYHQRGTAALVIRRVRSRIPSFETLHLPPGIGEFALAPRGLVLVTGPAASGKSTTLAAMVDYRNRHRHGHIITVEDPIEYLHADQLSAVSQREVGTDTESFAAALRGAPRQAPDVLVIGEMRDSDSAAAAVHFAETGHLLLGTLHALNASQGLERMLHLLPADSEDGAQARRLAAALVAIISQRLVPRADAPGLVPAVEVLRATPRVRELIRRGELPQLRQTMSEAHDAGMQTFDDALYGLFRRGMITMETCLDAAQSPGDLRMRLRAFSPTGRSPN